MIDFSFCTPTKYIFGRGAELKAGIQLSELEAKNTLIVFGRSSAIKSGLIEKVKSALEESGIKYILLGGVKPNPEDDLVYEGIDICRKNRIDSILAVGGGSVIDTAKAIAAGTLYDYDFWDFYSGLAVPQKALPIGVVLTIPAAGSEGSGNSVITKVTENGGIKISIRTESVLRPKFALLNPELTLSLPWEQTAAGIVDMMAHIMERYFSPTPDVEVTDRISEGLLIAIMEEATKLSNNANDYQARANIMWSGTLAHNGICGCGRQEDWASHAMEHELSAAYGVTHGAGLAVVFPAWLTFMSNINPSKIAQFGRRVMGIDCASDKEAARLGIAKLKEFFGSVLLMPLTLCQLGIEDPDIDMLVEHLHRNKGERIGGYHPICPEDSKAIYRLML